VVVSITVFDEAPTKVTLSTLLKSSVPWGVAMGIVSIIGGGFFKRKSPEDGTSASHLELGFLQSGTRSTLEENCLLRGDGPNRVSWIFGRCGEIAESLAVIQPLLFLFGGRMRIIDGHVLIRLVEEGVPLGAKFIKFFSIENCGPGVF